jgi:hypothetical protein
MFANPVTANPWGEDIMIYETSFNVRNNNCASYPERARIFVSQTGAADSWVEAGEVCQNGGVEIPAIFDNISYVRILDITNPDDFGANDEGYDVDGISAALEDNDPTRLCSGCGLSTVFSSLQGTTKGGTAIVANRSIATKAEGNTTGSDAAQTPMFFSLGFDNPNTADVEGEVVLKFRCTILDQQGADLRAFETSFGDNPSRTYTSYPEVAEFFGSTDNINYYPLVATNIRPVPATVTSSMLCRDGWLDISSMPVQYGVRAIKYLKIIDRSVRASNKFPRSADGYDVDAVVPVNCQLLTRNGRSSVEEGFTPDFITENLVDANLSVVPNPVSSSSNLEVLFTVNQAGSRTIELLDITGRVVQTIATAQFSEGEQHVNASLKGLAGIYVIRITGSEETLTTRVIVGN